jgi:hypothetical protein
MAYKSLLQFVSPLKQASHLNNCQGEIVALLVKLNPDTMPAINASEYHLISEGIADFPANEHHAWFDVEQICQDIGQWLDLVRKLREGINAQLETKRRPECPFIAFQKGLATVSKVVDSAPLSAPVQKTCSGQASSSMQVFQDMPMTSSSTPDSTGMTAQTSTVAPAPAVFTPMTPVPQA